ncbi:MULTISPECIES: carboxylesterase/lipase family protein [unclassified Novosphingobium]|uniref:carboxylesterase/lipase family protein n=1 Tax=unclassified Novosphingobium TaxID=2644732 RepID=UPI0017AEB9E4|nr:MULTISPECIES: carboxylesterase family protein [unclassified Novosphingobium]MBB3357803.1 para-nitrobenzyl esterase [Novosphingobium sp. BK256]MBB3373533.1 para-nitrobenzyl esterase [Novosphingobium sp. BK280]MBB3377945.1 para-nitrobenzyl esterase [Novosphingobium sp. BK258]MBB3420270.1 para-nitrobenzyl esterase [Novosphingobium sp. BK267]MBB3447408.1 para-nitrobenzyl esterase [Novosphingobium sp. BK352]
MTFRKTLMLSGLMLAGALSLPGATLAKAAPAAPAAPTVAVAQGTLVGAVEGTVASFKGIPYAAPPVGDLRWRAPQPAAAWSAPRDATHYGHDCAQAPFPPDAAPIRTQPAEDCLYLNVWKPAGAAANARLPVMVWVHGGGFVNGGTSPAVYSGAAFARDGVVLVSLNYRLGRFGFFAHPALKDEGLGGNFGFLDQIAALKWVQANVAAFGGDPANVTVFGESAGGMSMHMMLQSPLARGLFARAIIESGGGRDGTLPMPTMARAAKIGADFAPGLDAAALRALPEEKVTGNLSMMTMAQTGYSGPMVDGQTIVGASNDAAAAGIDAPVPVMIGANSADGFSFVNDKPTLFAAYGGDADKARALYDPQGTATGLVVGTMTSADRMFIEPARTIARTLAPRQPVYLYRFAYAHPEPLEKMGGAPHASELPYVFDSLAGRTTPKAIAAEQPVADLTHKMWVAFAKTGRPDGLPGLAPWPKVTPTDTTVHLITAAGATQVEDPYRARIDFVEQRIKP